MHLAAPFCFVAFWSFSLAVSQRHSLSPSTSHSRFRSLRVIDGSDVAPTEFPWQVAFVDVEHNEKFCGGAIIGERHILTAAHCVYGIPEDRIRIHTGLNNFEGKEHQGYKVESITIHEQYGNVYRSSCNSVLQNDIAVIILTEEIRMDDAEIIDLPSEEVTSGVTGTIIAAYVLESILKETEVSIIDHDDCERTYAINIEPEEICAVSNDVDQLTNQRDDGSPLVYDKKVVGIASRGIQRCDDNICQIPANYVDVHYYLEFIKKAKASV